jgi:hypothetical protein
MLPKIKQNNTNDVFRVNINVPTKSKQNKSRPNNDPYLKKNNFLISEAIESEQKKSEINANIREEIINDELYYEDLLDESNSDDNTVNLQTPNHNKQILSTPTLSTPTLTTPILSPLQYDKQHNNKINSVNNINVINNKINIVKPKNEIIDDAISLSLLILKLQLGEYNLMTFKDLNNHCNKLLQSETKSDYNKIYLAFNILSNEKK